MKVFKGLTVMAAVIICVCDMPSVSGQLPGLVADRNIGSATGVAPNLQFNVYYPDNASLTDIGTFRIMPSCNFDKVTSMSLVNTWTGLVIAMDSSLPPGTNLLWDMAAHPRLRPEYTGVYQCITGDGRRSAATYSLTIVARPTVTLPPTSSITIPRSIPPVTCQGFGNPAPRVSWVRTDTSEVLPSTNTTSNNSAFSFQVNSTLDVAALAEVTNPPETFTAQCRVEYVNIVCSVVTQNSTPINELCNSIRTPAVINSNLTVTESCPDLRNMSQYNFTGATFSTLPTTTLAVSCAAGYTLNNMTSSVTSITCQGNGSWTTLPICGDINECENMCTFTNTSTCTNVIGSFTCSCNAGYTGNGLAPGGCPVVQCPAQSTGTFTVPGSTYSSVVEVACTTGYEPTSLSIVNCTETGDFSPKPSCNATENFCMALLAGLNREATPGGIVGETRAVDCVPSFSAKPLTITCQTTGNWSDTTCSRNEEDKSNLGAILGGVFGGLVAIGIVIALIFYCTHKNKGDSDSNSGKSGPAIYSETTPNSKPKTKPKTSDVSDPDSASVPLVPVKTPDSKLLSQSGTNVRVNTTASNGDPPAETMYAEAGAPTRMSSSGGGVTGIDVGPVDSSTAPTNGQEENHYDTTATANKVWRGENGPPVPVPKTAIDIEMEGAYDTMAQFQHQV